MTNAAKNKGKGREIAPDSEPELEYDEAIDADGDEDDEASGSEFGENESDLELDEDEEMGDSSSNDATPGASRASRRREPMDEGDILSPGARAAEAAARRLARTQAGKPAYDIETPDSDGEPLAKAASQKTKKGKGKATAGPTAAELKGLNKDEKYLLRLKYKSPLKYDELVLSRKIGRKLTYVGLASLIQNIIWSLMPLTGREDNGRAPTIPP
jgi:hypothetical protein